MNWSRLFLTSSRMLIPKDNNCKNVQILSLYGGLFCILSVIKLFSFKIKGMIRQLGLTVN